MLFLGMISKSAPPSAIKRTKLLFHVIKAATHQLNNTNFGSRSNYRHRNGSIAFCLKCTQTPISGYSISGSNQQLVYAVQVTWWVVVRFDVSFPTFYKLKNQKNLQTRILQYKKWSRLTWVFTTKTKIDLYISSVSDYYYNFGISYCMLVETVTRVTYNVKHEQKHDKLINLWKGKNRMRKIQ